MAEQPRAFDLSGVRDGKEGAGPGGGSNSLPRSLTFFLFLEVCLYCYELPLRTAFTVSHRFWVVVFSFSFVSVQILISFLLSSGICWLFSSVLFSLHILEFLTVFLL